MHPFKTMKHLRAMWRSAESVENKMGLEKSKIYRMTKFSPEVLGAALAASAYLDDQLLGMEDLDNQIRLV
jgi:hypothetical protein